MMMAIGKKQLKALHILEIMSPIRDQKVVLEEYSPAIKEVVKQRHPELFPEPEGPAAEAPPALKGAVEHVNNLESLEQPQEAL